MRLARLAVLLAALAACEEQTSSRGAVAPDETMQPPSPSPDIPAARELDQQGVRSYLEGRYVDAIDLFRAAYAAGGPPSELWNIARCREKLDDSEGAAAAIQLYLAQAGLAPADRVEAERELRTLESRNSLLTIASTPEGAALAVDGRPCGNTPTSVEVRPGPHRVSLHIGGYADETRPVDARFGRALFVWLDLRPLPK
jgi:hypothetical protein